MVEISFLERWEELRNRRYHYQVIDLSVARYGNESDRIIFPCDKLVILQNDAPDMQIAFNEPTNFIPIPQFQYGYGRIEVSYAIQKIYLKHSAVNGGKLVLFGGFPEDINIAVNPTQGITILYDQVGLAKDSTVWRVATSVVIYNLVLTNANTEYSQTLPQNVKKFIMRARGGDVHISFTAGQSGTTYFTIASGGAYYEDGINVSTLTVYAQSPTAGTVLEIIAWS